MYLVTRLFLPHRKGRLLEPLSILPFLHLRDHQHHPGIASLQLSLYLPCWAVSLRWNYQRTVHSLRMLSSFELKNTILWAIFLQLACWWSESGFSLWVCYNSHLVFYCCLRVADCRHVPFLYLYWKIRKKKFANALILHDSNWSYHHSIKWKVRIDSNGYHRHLADLRWLWE